ncbi:PTCH1 [Cordylochernes scorpioides]|uniref:PTCH1 n=1 Tax=Cordylochernes scorpioides TaxID=51811 RepID=A0ABY6LJ76_9ARAC|nr:PTCH1 [Cordylochernes scorpioides]
MITKPAANQRVPSRTKPNLELLTRTSWTDAATGLAQIDKGKATGNKLALRLRIKLQFHLFHLGLFLQRNSGKVIFVALLVYSTFCVGLKSVVLQSNVEKLWVQEGGRLEKELRYMSRTLGDGAGTTSQLVVQTPRSGNVLRPDALLAHLRALQDATSVSVDVFDVTWKLKDICYSPSYPSFDTHYIDSILESLFPCAIITPLDCFWEGSLLLGPEFPVSVPGLGMNVQWVDLNPQTLVQNLRHFGNFANHFPFDGMEEYMKRAGITTGYQNKPCLNPADPSCPSTAPNKNSSQPPDIGAELTGGCFGFATTYMHWPESLLVGGVTRNRSGHIVRAEALQSVVQLLAEKQLYEVWKDSYKVHNQDWSVERARMVLEAWQRKFTQVLGNLHANLTRHHEFHGFSTTSLFDILKDFSEINPIQIGIGYLIMLVYAGVSLMKLSDPVKSQSGIGIAGVILVAFSVASGLGFCAILGLAFNAATTQIVPFLALGLGVDDMFIISQTYQQVAASLVPAEEQTGECLKRSGTTVLLTTVSNVLAFFTAALIPIPALRSFAIQAAILMVFNAASMILVFPAIASLDLARHASHRIDIFCCFKQRRARSILPDCVSVGDRAYTRQAISRLMPHCEQVETVLVPTEGLPGAKSELKTKPSPPPKVPKEKKSYHQLSILVSDYYAPFLQKPSVKVFGVITFILVLLISIWGLLKVEDGLDLTDIVPRNTKEYQFLNAQKQYFGFYNMFAVTQGNFEYPTNQALLHEYHASFTRIGKIIKNDDGGVPNFWLAMFRNWLLDLQAAFDKDWANGCITQERWYQNASDEGIFAFKLLVQTGRVDNPIDKSLVTHGRLVDKSGIINPKAFYNYLTAWVSNDALAFSASQASLQPEPRRWIHIPQDVELKIPKSQPLVYTQLPFYLHELRTTADIVETIQEIRALCERFEAKGLPNFPAGIPFTYWEQYISLRLHLAGSLFCIYFIVFVVVGLVLFNFHGALIMVVVLGAMTVQLLGVLGFLGVKLSAVLAVMLIAGVGVGVEFGVPILLGFLTGVGGKDRRMALALEHMAAPVVHGALSSLLGVLLLAFSSFDFILCYFFYVLVSLVIIGLVNGLFFLPVMLSLVCPLANPDRIATPSPPLLPRNQRHIVLPNSKRGNRNLTPHHSLTTITEEPQSYQSSDVVAVVETVTDVHQDPSPVPPYSTYHQPEDCGV